MKLFGKERAQVLTVTVDRDLVRPGDTIQAVIHVTGDPDNKARKAVGRLVCTHHWATESENEETGKVSIKKHHDEVVAGEHELVPDGTAVGEGDYAASFTLPADAIPSVTNVVEWSIEGVIHRRMGRDITTRVPLLVPTPPDLHAEVARHPGVAKHAPAFEVEAPLRTLRPGGTLAGTVIVRPAADVSYENLRIGLVLEREDRRDPSTDTRTALHAAKSLGDLAMNRDLPCKYSPKLFSPHELAAELKVAAGVVREFPFSVELPDDAPPTSIGRHEPPPV